MRRVLENSLTAWLIAVWLLVGAASADQILISAGKGNDEDAEQRSAFSDSFSDADRNGWFEIDDDSSTLSVKSNFGQLGSLPELNFTATETSSLKAFATHFSAVTLKNRGDFVTLQFDARHNNVGFGNRGFRFGLFDSNGTKFRADGDLDTNSVSRDDDGYFAMLDLGRSTTLESAVIRENNNGTDERLWNGRTIAFDKNDGARDPLIFMREKSYTYTFTLTRNRDGNVDIVLQNNVTGDEAALTGTSSLTPTLTLDTIYLGSNGSTADFAIDNVSVANRRADGVQSSAEKKRVGVYLDVGAGPSVNDLLFVLGKIDGVSVKRLSADAIRSGKLSGIDVLIHPGGTGSGQGRNLGEDGRKAIREFVHDGGGFIGICGGAYLATADYDWSLHILDAKVLDRKHWARGHGDVKIGITDSGKSLMKTKESQMTILYWQGPLLAPANRSEIEDYETIATFDTEIAENGAPKGVMLGSTAIARGEFGNGRVVCFSPHPELTKGLEPLVKHAIDHVRRARLPQRHENAPGDQPTRSTSPPARQEISK